MTMQDSRQIKAKINCRIICHKNAITLLENGKSESNMRPINVFMYLISSLGKLFHVEKEYTPVILDENDIIVSGDNKNMLRQIDIRGRLIYIPGHTKDSISLVMEMVMLLCDVATNMLNEGGVKYRPMYIEDLNSVFENWQKIIDNGRR